MENLATAFQDYATLDRRRTEDGLTVPELERWSRLKRLLTQRFSPGLDPREVDRRRSVRIPTRLRVRYESENGFAQSQLTIDATVILIALDHQAHFQGALARVFQLDDDSPLGINEHG